MDARLAFAIELEQRDEVVGARLAELAELTRAVRDVTNRAAEVHAFFGRLPAERELLARQAADAEAALARARAAQEAAAQAVERARRDEAREAARRDEARAAADVRDAEERLDRLGARRGALEHEAEQLGAESADLERAAAGLAQRLEAAPRASRTAPPKAGLDEVAAWGARAGAALFVARAGLEAERERIVREANELASSALGEPLHSTSVALVRRRLEQSLG